MCIFEEDYDRAAACLMDEKSGLKDGAVLQCARTDPGYYLGWMKVRDRHSHVYPDAPRFRENGVWIDLYKLVRCERREIAYLAAKEAMDYLGRRLAAGGMTKEEYEGRVRDGRLEEKLAAAKKMKEGSDDGTETYLIWSASKIAVDKEWVEPLSVVRFEGMEVTTFGEPEKYLVRHYGDAYGEFPPEEMRRVGIRRVVSDGL